MGWTISRIPDEHSKYIRIINAQYSTVYSTVQYSTVQYSTVQYSTVPVRYCTSTLVYILVLVRVLYLYEFIILVRVRVPNRNTSTSTSKVAESIRVATNPTYSLGYSNIFSWTVEIDRGNLSLDRVWSLAYSYEYCTTVHLYCTR